MRKHECGVDTPGHTSLLVVVATIIGKQQDQLAR